MTFFIAIMFSDKANFELAAVAVTLIILMTDIKCNYNKMLVPQNCVTIQMFRKVCTVLGHVHVFVILL